MTELKRNHRRRAFGVAICFSPLILLAASIIVGNVWPRESPWGLGLVLAGLLFASLNLYLSFVRPVLHFWRRGSMEGYPFISGIPLLGNMFTLAGGPVGFADWKVAAAGIVALALDVGGLPLFLFATWRDESFWDG